MREWMTTLHSIHAHPRSQKREMSGDEGSRKWEDEDCPAWKCPKDKTICNCKQGGGIGKASLISCQKFRDFMGWPTNPDNGHKALCPLSRHV